MNRNIELEFRANVPRKLVSSVHKKLQKMAKSKDQTKRISMMSFGKTAKYQLDIRVRMTNGNAEVVIKRGDLHSHDRVEVSQTIEAKQFLGFVKLFALFGFDTEIAERFTTNYYLPNGTVASVVEAGSIVYLEIEKLSAKKEVKQNSKLLLSLFGQLQLDKHMLATKKDFDDLCDLLSKKTDWKFTDSPAQYTKLEKLLANYVTNKL